MKVLLAFALFAISAAPIVAQTSPASQKLELNDPKVPIAPENAKQPASAVLDSTGIPGAKDKALEDSRVAGQRTGAALRVGSSISIQLAAAVNSGMVKNGDAVHGTLSAPVKTTAGVMLPPGTKVEGTVVSAARAGTLQSAGILSLQLTRVGSVPVVTDVLDFSGQEGHKDLADSAPAKGTEAVTQAGATLQFHVLENGPVPGIIPGGRLPVGGGKRGGSPSAMPSTGEPSTGPGVNQTPANGDSQPAQTTPPASVPVH